MRVVEPWYALLACRFLAELLQRIMDIADDAAY
jgi:hypothetical protein